LTNAAVAAATAAIASRPKSLAAIGMAAALNHCTHKRFKSNALQQKMKQNDASNTILM
jgi:hypothetical protein